MAETALEGTGPSPAGPWGRGPFSRRAVPRSRPWRVDLPASPPIRLPGGPVTTHLAFMADDEVRCEACKGARTNAETLEVAYRGKTIADVLDMPVEDGSDHCFTTVSDQC